MTEPDAIAVPPHYKQARRLHIEGKHAEAEAAYCAALDQTPEDSMLLFFLGTLFMQTKRHGLAIALLVRCVELNSKASEAFNNLGMCLKSVGKLHEAGLAFERALRLAKTADYYNNVASLRVNAGTAQSLIDVCDQALALEPKHPQARWNRALGYLELGMWAQGWDEYGWGYRARGRANRQYDCAPWDGKPVETLIIYGEQGIGDEILFGEIMRDAYDRVGKLVIDCHPRLVEMFKRSFPKADVYGTRKQMEIQWLFDYPKVDAKASMCDLAKLFRRTDGAFPGTPYIATDPNRDGMVRSWLNSLPPGLRVGISWQGGTKETHINLRSIAPPMLAPILQVPGVTWVNLQYGPMTESVAQAIREDIGPTIHTNKPLIDDFDTLTSLIGAVDLLITVDQSAVWQAGAIDAECWVMLPDATSWRYPHRFGRRTPWFRSIELFRQDSVARSWPSVVEEMHKRLVERVENARQEGPKSTREVRGIFAKRQAAE